MSDEDDDGVDLHEALDALETAIESADPAARQALAEAWHGCRLLRWAYDPQAQLLLYHIVAAIDDACQPPDDEPKHPKRHGLRLVHPRKPGSAA